MIQKSETIFRRDGSVGVMIECGICKQVYAIVLSNEEYTRYFVNEERIQHPMPNQPPTIRELLVSGVCRECFDMFLKEKEEDGSEG